MSPNDAAIEVVGDRVFVCPTWTYAHLVSHFTDVYDEASGAELAFDLEPGIVEGRSAALSVF